MERFVGLRINGEVRFIYGARSELRFNDGEVKTQLRHEWEDRERSKPLLVQIISSNPC